MRKINDLTARRDNEQERPADHFGEKVVRKASVIFPLKILPLKYSAKRNYKKVKVYYFLNSSFMGSMKAHYGKTVQRHSERFTKRSSLGAPPITCICAASVLLTGGHNS